MSIDFDRFRDWLVDQGASLAEPTNAFEVLRYKLDGATHIIWTKANGRLTWSETAQVHYEAFKSDCSWDRVRRVGGIARLRTVKSLIARDGANCWLCGHPLKEDITIEHLLNISAGGSNAMENLCLVHERCNSDLGNLSIVQKVALREKRKVAA